MVSKLGKRLNDHPSWVDLGLPALTVVFGLQSLRILLSLASFLLRDVYDWDAQYIGALGLALMSMGFLAGLVRRLLGVRLMLVVTAGGLGVLRLAAQVWFGDTLVDFVLVSGAVVLFVLFLPAYLGYCRGRTDASRGLPLGLLTGLSADLALHGAYTTYDLAWTSGTETLVVIGALTALQLGLLFGLQARVIEGEDDWRGSWTQLLPWLGIGPFLFLQLLVLQNLARLVSLTDWSFPYAYAWALFGHAAGILVALWVLHNMRRSFWPLATVAGALLIGAAAVQSEGVALTAGAMLVGQIVSALLLTLVVTGQGTTDGTLGRGKSSVVHGLGMVLLLVFLFGYYAVYDMDLPFANTWLPPIAGLALGICGLASLFSLPRPSMPRRIRWAPAQISLTLLIVPLVWAFTWESPPPIVGAGYPVRIMSYNVHNGFDTDGHLGMEAIARVIEAERPDVVGLQEVSRGWVVNGSLDMLTWLSQRLELPFVYGPVTGPLWGNAVLSRYPIIDWGSVRLPPDGLLLQRGYLWARLDLGDGQELRVVNTHLHHTGEGQAIRAEQIETLLDFWNGEAGTVIMGDFNARRNDAETEMMRQAGMADVHDLAGSGPGYTSPAKSPHQGIDYIWLSPDLTATDVDIPSSTASDHLPVVASIDREF